MASCKLARLLLVVLVCRHLQCQLSLGRTQRNGRSFQLTSRTSITGPEGNEKKKLQYMASLIFAFVTCTESLLFSQIRG